MATRSHRLALTCTPAEHGAHLAAPLPPGAAGAWCALRLSLADPGQTGRRHAGPGPWWAKLSLADRARGQVVREVFLGPLRRHGDRAARATLVHVPAESRDLVIELFGAPTPQLRPAGTPSGGDRSGGVHCRLTVLSRGRAALLLAWHGARLLPAAVWGSPWGVLGRVRALIGQAPARAGQVPPYAAWVALFERAPDAAARQDAAAWDAQIAIFAGPDAALAASRASAARQQPGGGPARIVAAAADWAGLSASWIVLLEAGEILAPGACAAFARAAAFCPWAEMLTADCDTLAGDGTRADPLFKPGPDTLLPGSALLAKGAMAVRREHIVASLPLHAGVARAVLARRAVGRIAHVPGVLSHVPDSAVSPGGVAPPAVSQAAPPGEVAQAGWVASGRQDSAAGQTQPSVTILIPSAARGAHVAACLRAVSRDTDYANFTIRLVLSAPGQARARVCRAASRVPRVTIQPVDVTPFNYARVNNQAARGCSTDLLLLMNDDVAPIGRGWLNAMVAHMDDPAVGIVGARLLYGNGMVQHEGVIMGLANLCEHAGRLRDAADPGPHGIALLDREVCAVTGACLLIRSCLYSDLGGMDEAYAVALNDVDLCLRAREAGWRVVYCAGAVLHHYESLSLGRHYSGARAGLESVEVRRLRARFADAIEADPFYNPLASLQPGREWQPAFPPRPHPPALGTPSRTPAWSPGRAPSP